MILFRSHLLTEDDGYLLTEDSKHLFISVTGDEYSQWLASDDAIRCILFEIDYINVSTHTPGTLYASDRGYISYPSDDPPNTPYDDIVVGTPTITRSVRLPTPNEGSLSIKSETGWGSLDISNLGGARDNWITDFSFIGREIRVYRGDPSWLKSDFRLVSKFITSRVNGSSTKITFQFKSKIELLNKKIQTAELSSGPSAGHRVPLSFGNLYNAEPVCIDAATHQYQYHETAISGISQVRDRGVSVSYTQQSGGKLLLTAGPTGKITMDLIGDASDGVYRSLPGELAKLLVMRAGIDAADIDTAAFDALDADAPYTIGLYVRDGDNLFDAIDAVLSSVGAFIFTRRDGKFSVRRLTVPGTPFGEVTQDDILHRSLEIEDEIEPIYKVSVGYKRNWSPQDSDSLAGVTETLKAEYSQEYRYTAEEDTSVLTDYPLAGYVTVDTLLQDETQANEEADRLLALWKEKKFVFSQMCKLSQANIDLCDTATLVHPRFGLSGGKDGIIVRIDERLESNRMKLYLLV